MGVQETTILNTAGGRFSEESVSLEDIDPRDQNPRSASFRLSWSPSEGKGGSLNVLVGHESSGNFRLFLDRHVGAHDQIASFGKLVVDNFDSADDRQVQKLLNELTAIVTRLDIQVQEEPSSENGHTYLLRIGPA